MGINITILDRFKNRTVALLVLVPIIILILVFLIMSINSVILLKKQNQSSQERIAQLEEIVEKFTGAVPPENLYSVSGFALGIKVNLKGDSTLYLYPEEIHEKEEVLEASRYIKMLREYDTDKVLKMTITPETKIRVKVYQGSDLFPEDLYLTEEFIQARYKDLTVYGSITSKVFVTTTSDPKEQSKITAYSITIYPITIDEGSSSRAPLN
ncbi:hypothetical protein ACFL11_00090 [Patescibacteria group bacterium]